MKKLLWCFCLMLLFVWINRVTAATNITLRIAPGIWAGTINGTNALIVGPDGWIVMDSWRKTWPAGGSGGVQTNDDYSVLSGYPFLSAETDPVWGSESNLYVTLTALGLELAGYMPLSPWSADVVTQLVEGSNITITRVGNTATISSSSGGGSGEYVAAAGGLITENRDDGTNTLTLTLGTVQGVAGGVLSTGRASGATYWFPPVGDVLGWTRVDTAGTISNWLWFSDTSVVGVAPYIPVDPATIGTIAWSNNTDYVHVTIGTAISNIAAAARAEALILSNKHYFSGWSPGPIYTNTGAVTEEIWVLNSTWGDLARGYELDIITNAATAGWRMYVYDWRTNAVGDLSWVETTGTPTAQDWRTLATLLPFTPPRPRVAFLGANYPFDGSNMVRTAAGVYSNAIVWVGATGNITQIVQGAAATVGLFGGSGTTGSVTSAAGDAGKFLRADGAFATPSTSGGTIAIESNSVSVNTEATGINFASPGFAVVSNASGSVTVSNTASSGATWTNSYITLVQTGAVNLTVNGTTVIPWSYTTEAKATNGTLVAVLSSGVVTGVVAGVYRVSAFAHAGIVGGSTTFVALNAQTNGVAAARLAQFQPYSSSIAVPLSSAARLFNVPAGTAFSFDVTMGAGPSSANINSGAENIRTWATVEYLGP